jgi:NAD kinase
MSAMAALAPGLRRTGPRRALFEKVVVVTRRTRLEELVARFNTLPQARFYLERAGEAFAPIEADHARYQDALRRVRDAIPAGTRSQVIERTLVPQFSFGEDDLVITVGPDGLMVNVAKYLAGQPILAVNPDPEAIEGVLLPFDAAAAGRALDRTLRGAATLRAVSMAEARLDDGQSLLGFNDLFVGARSHVSARYRIGQAGAAEEQSSSGVIISTGAGSTGWLRSVYAGAAGVVETLGGQVVLPPDGGRFAWDADYLVYAVREPWPSKTTAARRVFGLITAQQPLELYSHMPEQGVIFSDGVEQDYLAFTAGRTARIGLAPQKARLVVA